MNILRIFTILVGVVVFGLPTASNAHVGLLEANCKGEVWHVGDPGRYDFNVAGPGNCISSLQSGTALFWNLHEDFLLSPNEQNPSPDQYGNLDVWHYRYSESLDHDPTTYVLYNHYVMDDQAPFGAREFWTADPTSENHAPLLGIPSTELSETDEDDMGIALPSTTQLTMASWQSPINGNISIVGRNAHNDPTCFEGNGVVWSVEREIDGSSVVLAQGPLEEGQSFSGVIWYTLWLNVSVGDMINFIIDPGQDGDECNLTDIYPTIVGYPR